MEEFRKLSALNGVNNSRSTYNNINHLNKSTESNQKFIEVLNKTNELKFSKHAIKRLDTRGINLTETEVQRLENGVGQAIKKGIRDVLILMDNKVFVANVKNKTVVTATKTDVLKENIFTNIDGAVII